LSMALSPLLLSMQTRVLEWLLRRNPAEVFDHVEPEGSRVIIAGFGRFGQIVGRVLRMRRIKFTALESSQSQVDFVRRFGNQVYYGDASRLELLQAAGAEEAEVLVLAMDDIEASVRAAELVKRHFPRLKVFARARNRQHALRLMEIGVRYLMRETFLSSLDMSQQILEALGMSHSDALLSAEKFRDHDEQQLRAQLAVKDDEQKLIQTARLAAKELEGLFEADEPAITAEVPQIRVAS
jgi:voltage-gated potassium channel Kch